MGNYQVNLYHEGVKFCSSVITELPTAVKLALDFNREGYHFEVIERMFGAEIPYRSMDGLEELLRQDRAGVEDARDIFRDRKQAQVQGSEEGL